MLFKNRLHGAHQAGFRQGMWTALLVASPFIIAGVKWMADNREPVMDRMKDLKETDFYTRVFDKDSYQEKEAKRKLEKFRLSEGNYNEYDTEASSEEDEALFHILKEITKNELSKKNEK